MKNISWFPACVRMSVLSVLTVLGAIAEDGVHREVAFKTSSNLVLVPVTVTNQQGGTVNGLSRNQFRIQENRTTQYISSLNEQDVPVSMGIVLDTSGSMNEELPEAKIALKEFLDETSPGDEAFLYTVSTHPRQESLFTADFDRLIGDVSFRNAFGSTALIDTIYAGLDGLRSARQNRKALIVISDGMDNHSRYSKAELMSRALESDAQIYTISIYDPPAYKKPMQLSEERAGLKLMDELARKTGGVSFVIHNSTGLHSAIAQISHALRNQYVIGYVPQPVEQGGKWHAIRVTVAVPHTTVYARSGYRAD